jgi:hypothetical protein
MYLLRETSRNAFDGVETSKNFVFQTIEDLAEFVYSTWYDMFCDDWGFPANWDAEVMGCEFPSKEEFDSKVICEKLKLAKINIIRPKQLFGPYSKYYNNVPLDLIVYKTNAQ